MLWRIVTLASPALVLLPVYGVGILGDFFERRDQRYTMVAHLVSVTAVAAGFAVVLGVPVDIGVGPAFVALVPLGIVLYRVENALATRTPDSAGTPVGEAGGSGLLVALAVLVVPVPEEFIFRAVVRHVFVDLGVGSYLLLSSAQFGVLHSLFGTREVVFKTATGLVFGGVFVATGSLVAPVVVHVSYNVGYLLTRVEVTIE